MPIFGFFGGNFSWLAKRGSRLVARGSGSQARKIASPNITSAGIPDLNLCHMHCHNIFISHVRMLEIDIHLKATNSMSA